MDGTLRSNSAWLIDCLSLVNLNFMLFCLNVSLFDAAILTTFELSTKSFLKIFFLVSRQSSRNPQLGIVKAVFDRQLFSRQSSRYRQDIVKASSRRQSSIVSRQQLVNVCTCVCVRVCVCARARVCVCVCVCVCVVPGYIGAKIQTKREKKVFEKFLKKSFAV